MFGDNGIHRLIKDLVTKASFLLKSFLFSGKGAGEGGGIGLENSDLFLLFSLLFPDKFREGKSCSGRHEFCPSDSKAGRHI